MALQNYGQNKHNEISFTLSYNVCWQVKHFNLHIKKLKNCGLKSSRFILVSLNMSLGNLNYRPVTCKASDKFTPINSVTNSLTSTEIVMTLDKILTHALLS
jgi:outer membrane usher protein FimD/PapC